MMPAPEITLTGYQNATMAFFKGVVDYWKKSCRFVSAQNFMHDKQR
jgi:hypothetical protein